MIEKGNVLGYILIQEEVGINNGEWYFTPYDKTHDLSVTSNYELNKKWSLSANFLFQTSEVY